MPCSSICHEPQFGFSVGWLGTLSDWFGLWVLPTVYAAWLLHVRHYCTGDCACPPTLRCAAPHDYLIRQQTTCFQTPAHPGAVAALSEEPLHPALGVRVGGAAADDAAARLSQLRLLRHHPQGRHPQTQPRRTQVLPHRLVMTRE